MIEQQHLAHAIRFLSVDAVEKAQSGHPGMPLGMADIATVLWTQFLNHNPKNPQWFNRDRFVLSNGHGSMLLYALLHLSGYNVSIEDLQQFRQLHSITPGHPECTDTPGVETTTGPLGQGLANAVGMALAEKVLAAQFNTNALSLIDHHTYVFAGDGCLMEGISHEACSLAGTLALGKLIVFYDDNGISIDGAVDRWFTDNTRQRFEAYNWHVIDSVDGHDMHAVAAAITEAKQETDKPTLIICKTLIGYGSQLAGSEKSHGAPLGAQGIDALRQTLNWPHPAFHIPTEIYEQWNQQDKGIALEQTWLEQCAHYQETHPERYREFLRRINGDLPDEWTDVCQQLMTVCKENQDKLATRKASQMCLEYLQPHLPELFGGSADLTESNNTKIPHNTIVDNRHSNGNYLHYGVREFAMSAMMNGIALHGGFIPYGGTFLVFCDYARNAVRMSALMQQRVVFVYSHDSIGLGEDGPTHQPIEHIAMLRMTPNLAVWRPADLVETGVSWQCAVARHYGPSALLLSRQSLPQMVNDNVSVSDILRGGYVLRDSGKEPEVILIATGSEVHLAVASYDDLNAQGIACRVVSMPCAEVFLEQDAAYQNTVIPSSCKKRIAIEAGSTAYWYRFVGLDGRVIGIDTFGVSAPGQEAFDHFSITTDNITHLAKELVES